MIYKIINGNLTKFVDKNGKKFRKNSQKLKRLRTKKSKRSHEFSSFYNTHAWHKLSKDIRKHEPLCRVCRKEYHDGYRPLNKVHLSQSVDHIKPLKTKDGWENRLNPNNLQPLCHYHHLLKDKKGL